MYEKGGVHRMSDPDVKKPQKYTIAFYKSIHEYLKIPWLYGCTWALKNLYTS